jgi:MFS family permease
VETIKQGLRLLTRRRNFALLMAVQLCALGGDGVVQTALAKYIAFGQQRGFDLEGARSPQELLRIALYLMIPYTIISPFLGVVIDRWDRRRVLLLANGVRAVVLAAIAVAGIEEVGEVPLFVAFVFTLMSTRAVLATKAAALPATLGGTSLLAGNAVSQLGGALAQLGGAGVAFVAAGFLSVEALVLAGAAVYGLGALAALPLWEVGEPRPRAGLVWELGHVARNIAAGVREVARTPKAGASITTYFWLRYLWSFSLVGIGFVARELLAGDEVVIAATIGGGGAAGAALGFLLSSRLAERTKTTARLVLRSASVAGLAVVALGGLRAGAALALLAFFLGLGFFIAKISLDTMVQEALGDDFRGRAFSLYDIAYNLAWVVAAGVMKLLWAPWRQGAVLALMGVVFLAGLAGLARWYGRAGLLAPSLQRVG